MFLTGVGPLLAWRKISTESLKRNFGWPLGTGLFAGVVAFALGFRELFSLICLILRIFVASTIGLEFYRGAKVIRARSGASFVASTVDLTMRNTRRYGGYIVHVGMVFVFIGLSGAAFNRDTQKEMQLGQTMQIGPYTLQLQGFDTKPEKNYTAERMIVEVLRDNKPLMMLYPEKRKFATTDQNGTMVAIYSTLKEDLYVVFAGYATSGDARLSEPTRKMDLVWRRIRGFRDDRGAVALCWCWPVRNSPLLRRRWHKRLRPTATLREGRPCGPH